jgi:ribosomal protein L24
MKVGDMVKKIEGRHEGKSGIIIQVYNKSNARHHTVLEILVDGKIDSWAAHLVEVISESR